MPRKSQALRLQQTQELITEYNNIGAGGTPLQFMNDMVRQMERGKYPTKRQRDWLDKLIDEGPPIPREPSELWKRMEAARAVFIADAEKDWEVKVLGDFMHRETKGWDFSEKQTALVAKLINQAEKLKLGEHKLELDESQRADLELACKLWNGYAPLWRAERPGLAKARERCLQYLNGETYIEQYHYDKVTNAVAAKIKAFKDARFNAGDMGYTGRGESKMVWICASDPYICERGRIVNDWIGSTGELVQMPHQQIGKR